MTLYCECGYDTQKSQLDRGKTSCLVCDKPFRHAAKNSPLLNAVDRQLFLDIEERTKKRRKASTDNTFYRERVKQYRKTKTERANRKVNPTSLEDLEMLCKLFRKHLNA